VPENLPLIIKNYSKAVIKANPSEMVEFSAKYFENLLRQREKEPDKTGYSDIKKPDSNQISQKKSEKLDNANMRQFFDQVDTNKSGLVSSYELQAHLAKKGFHFDNLQIEEFLKIHDKNSDDLLNFDEFVLMAKKCGIMN